MKDLPTILLEDEARNISDLRRYGLAVCEHEWHIAGPAKGTCRHCGIEEPTKWEIFWETD